MSGDQNLGLRQAAKVSLVNELSPEATLCTTCKNARQSRAACLRVAGHIECKSIIWVEGKRQSKQLRGAASTSHVVCIDAEWEGADASLAGLYQVVTCVACCHASRASCGQHAGAAGGWGCSAQHTTMNPQDVLPEASAPVLQGLWGGIGAHRTAATRMADCPWSRGCLHTVRRDATGNWHP